jgi:amidophosphoribosyltransferase
MLTTHPFADDKLREECGVFGIWGADTSAAIVALGLHALQHRGQEAAGITSWDGRNFHSHRAQGHVAGNFDKDDIIRRLSGEAAIGHVRYSTTGETALRNVQPLFAELSSGGFAIAHNGNISNAMKIRRELNRRGSIFQSTSDTEVIIHLVATSSYRTLLDRFHRRLQAGGGRLQPGLPHRRGHDRLPRPARHPTARHGPARRRLHLRIGNGALDVVGATYLRSVEPGELIIVSARGIQSHRPFAPVRPRPCIFEHVYFSRPDSIVDGASVYTVRKRIGAELARENPVDADYVVPVPDSGVPAAIGYAQESGVPFELGIIRSHYVGRTFIQPSDQVRHLGVKLKHNANTALIQGKKIVLIDDSIVRGTDVAQDRADAARVRRARGSHADRLAPDQAQLLLRRRHARARQAARRADERRADERIYPRRQPRLRVDRRPLPRAGRGGAGRSAAAALRRLLLRPVSDAADRP